MHVTYQRCLRSTAVAALGLGLACGGGDGGPTDPPGPATLSLVSGDQQNGVVGQALGQPIVVRASRGSQPASGVVVAFAVTTGGGFLSRTTATTDNTGTVSVTWTLGGQAGAQTVTVSSGTLSVVTVSATAAAGDPASIVPVAGNSQFVVVGRAVPIKPRVQLTDQFGNPSPGRTVTFAITAGAGTITGAVQTTDAAGNAELGGWTLGSAAGTNRVLASFGPTVSAELIAIGTPAALVAVDGDAQTANIGTAVPLAPAVLAIDGDGQPLSDVSVIFQVSSGGGSVAGSTQMTNAQGIARAGSWVLGLTAGANALSATTFGVTPATFTATGIVGVPSAMVASGPTAFSGLVGNFVPAAPTIRLTDAGGNPVAGIQVTFEVTSGGGVVATAGSSLLSTGGFASLAGPSVTTDANGMSSLGSWRLGPGTGTQTVQATAGALPPIVFSATANPIPPAAYDIVVRFQGTEPSATQKAAFEQAAARWEQIILGDVEDELVQLPSSPFGCYPALDETIDDIVIYAEVVPIDGAGGILGSAGPCVYRLGSFHTVVGRMRFDSADLATLETQGRLADVILHEMGHVLGFGTFWSDLGLLTGPVAGDPFFNGVAARAAWTAATQALGFTGNIVPVEGGSQPGTSGSHWRESIARNELMTGFLNQGVNPLSAFTINSMRDMGYVVNDLVAEEFTLSALLQGLAAPAMQLREAPLEGPVLVIHRGRVVGSRPRRPF